MREGNCQCTILQLIYLKELPDNIMVYVILTKKQLEAGGNPTLLGAPPLAAMWALLK